MHFNSLIKLHHNEVLNTKIAFLKDKKIHNIEKQCRSIILTCGSAELTAVWAATQASANVSMAA